MNALSLYCQVGIALLLGRLAWQLLRAGLLRRPSGPSAPLSSALGHGLFALSLTLPFLLLALPDSASVVRRTPAPASAPATAADALPASGFVLLGERLSGAVPPEVWASLPLLLGALLLPFVLVAAWRTAGQWLWLRGVVTRAACRRRLGRVRVLVSDEIDTPFSTAAFGLAHVVLPHALPLSGRDRELVLRHELHHHRRRDVLWALLLDALRVVFAWNPAMHAWARDLSDWQERACDAQLIERGAPLRAYAGCLLRVAEHGLHSSPLPVASAAMARSNGRSALKRRIEMLLDTKTRSGRLEARGIALALGLGALLTTGTWAVAAALPQAAPAQPGSANLAATTTFAMVSSPMETSVKAGSLAPDIELADGRGRTTSLHDLRGRVVVLDFWADWCRFCNEAVTPLKSLETEVGADELAIVGVSVDTDREAFDRFLTEHELEWPQHHASDGMKGDTARTYGVRALPLHVVIDRQGRVAASGVQLAQLRPTIDALLDGEDASLGR